MPVTLYDYIEYLEFRVAKCWRDTLEFRDGYSEPQNELFQTILLLEEARSERTSASRNGPVAY